MTVKSMMTPHGQRVYFGRRRPVVRRPHLQLRNYMPKIAAPPPTIDYSPNAAASLAQMYENDTFGDCVIAGIAHVDGVLTGNAANPAGGLILPNTQITSLYSQWCGYVPGQPSTDQGCDVQAVLAAWKSTGFADPTTGAPHIISGILGVDPTNMAEVQTAIWLFENVIFGVELPDAWVTPMPSASGFIWDVAGQPDPNNGHCFPGLGYDSAKVMISTWAMTGYITWAAIAEYAAASAQGELYAVLSQDGINKGSQVAPSGLNWTQLQADFAALSAPPSPSPTPTPVPPTPTPPPPPPPPSPGPTGNPPSAAILKTWLDDYKAYLATLN